MPDSLPTAARLSRWLRSSGALARGDVAHIHIDLEHKTDLHELVFLTVTYTPDAPSALPRHLVVKTPRIQSSDDNHRYGEQQFYREVSSVLPSPPVVQCLALIGSDDEDSGTIVLQDLRATHDHPPWPIPPTKYQSEIAVDALAHVHARYWEAATLGNSIGEQPMAQSLTTMVQGIAASVPAFMDAFGDSLCAAGRQVYERVFASSLKPWLRLTDSRALTIIHGDAHTWNFLFPRSGSGPAYLLDWQTWHIDVGARDLAFLMALHWYPSRRRELEKQLIQRYHEALVAHGITNYTLADLWLDYRRCAVRNLTIPIIFWSRGMKPEGWWHRLECALAAYDDLACYELL